MYNLAEPRKTGFKYKEGGEQAQIQITNIISKQNPEDAYYRVPVYGGNDTLRWNVRVVPTQIDYI